MKLRTLLTACLSFVALLVTVLPAAEIHEAVNRNDLARVKQLLEKDPKVLDLKDVNIGYTPLHWAVVRNYAHIAKYLIDQGADVSVRSRYNYTVLHLAAMNGRKDLAELL